MNTQLIVRLPEEQKTILEIIACQRRISVSELTRQAISKYIMKPESNDSLFLRLAKIGKNAKIKNAPKDLSSNYKTYLYERK